MNKKLEELDKMRLKQNDIEIEKLQQELKQIKETMEDTAKLEELLEKKNGVSAVHKGSCDEKYVEIVLKSIASNDYIIDSSKGTKKMDIRMINKKDISITIGIECKDKNVITKHDIDKFKRDKVSNKFYKSIFISTGPIQKIVEEENNVYNNGDELYIYTKDPVFLAAVIKQYISSLSGKEENNNLDGTLLFEHILSLYRAWQSSKKSLAELDKGFINALQLNENYNTIMKGHLYFSPLSNLKSKKS